LISDHIACISIFLAYIQQIFVTKLKAIGWLKQVRKPEPFYRSSFPKRARHQGIPYIAITYQVYDNGV